MLYIFSVEAGKPFAAAPPVLAQVEALSKVVPLIFTLHISSSAALVALEVAYPVGILIDPLGPITANKFTVPPPQTVVGLMIAELITGLGFTGIERVAAAAQPVPALSPSTL